MVEERERERMQQLEAAMEHGLWMPNWFQNISRLAEPNNQAMFKGVLSNWGHRFGQ